MAFQLVLISASNSLERKGVKEAIKITSALSGASNTWVVVTTLQENEVGFRSSDCRERQNRRLGFTWVQMHLHVLYLSIWAAAPRLTKEQLRAAQSSTHSTPTCLQDVASILGADSFSNLVTYLVVIIQCFMGAFHCLNPKCNVYLNFISARNNCLTMFTGLLGNFQSRESPVEKSRRPLCIKGIVLGCVYPGFWVDSEVLLALCSRIHWVVSIKCF